MSENPQSTSADTTNPTNATQTPQSTTAQPQTFPMPTATAGELKKRVIRTGQDGKPVVEEEYFPASQNTHPVVLQQPCGCGDKITELEKRLETMKTELTGGIKTMQDSFKGLEKNVNEVNELKLNSLTSDILKIDPEFKLEKLVSENSSLTERIIFCQKYLERLNSIKKNITEGPTKVKLEQTSSEQKRKLELARNMFGSDAKKYYPDIEKVLGAS